MIKAHQQLLSDARLAAIAAVTSDGSPESIAALKALEAYAVALRGDGPTTIGDVATSVFTHAEIKRATRRTK